MEGMKTLDAVADEYVRMWTYYAGDLPEYFSGRAIKRLIETTSTDYRIRLARKPVNALANRVSVASITSSSGDRVNRVIENLRTSNDMELQEPFLHTRLFAFGDAYMFVFPVDEDEDTAQRDGERIDAVPDADTRRAGVEFAYQSPISCRAFYDAEDGRRIRFVVRRWREVNPYGMKVWRAEVWYSDRMEPWVTIPDGNGLDEEAWLPYAEDDQGNQVPTSGDNWPEYHDFNEIPIKHARTDLPYGRPSPRSHLASSPTGGVSGTASQTMPPSSTRQGIRWRGTTRPTRVRLRSSLHPRSAGAAPARNRSSTAQRRWGSSPLPIWVRSPIPSSSGYGWVPQPPTHPCTSMTRVPASRCPASPASVLTLP
jgi:hypothetical protein